MHVLEKEGGGSFKCIEMLEPDILVSFEEKDMSNLLSTLANICIIL